MGGDQPQYWFRAKRYGWGWGMPSSWEGWVVMVGWLVVIMGIGPVLATHSMVLFGVFIGVMCVALIAICYAKGEPPRWRWGK